MPLDELRLGRMICLARLLVMISFLLRPESDSRVYFVVWLERTNLDVHRSTPLVRTAKITGGTNTKLLCFQCLLRRRFIRQTVRGGNRGGGNVLCAAGGRLPYANLLDDATVVEAARALHGWSAAVVAALLSGSCSTRVICNDGSRTPRRRHHHVNKRPYPPPPLPPPSTRGR
jgi:hypothetical protein